MKVTPSDSRPPRASAQPPPPAPRRTDTPPPEPVWHVAAASACGGVVEAVLQNPWRIVKNIQQVQTPPQSTLATLATLGPRRCMEGLGLNVALAVQSNMIFYSLHHALVHRFARDKDHPTPLLSAAAGAAAGVAEAFLTNPVRRVQVLQDAGGKAIARMPPWRAVHHLAIHEGVPSLWQGAGAAAMRNAAAIGTFFGMVALCQGFALRHGTMGDLGVGAAAEAGAALVSNPLDTLTSRMYAGDRQLPAWEVARDMLLHEGPGSFMAGTTANILRLAPSTAADFATTSLARRTLRKRQLNAWQQKRPGVPALRPVPRNGRKPRRESLLPPAPGGQLKP